MSLLQNRTSAVHSDTSLRTAVAKPSVASHVVAISEVRLVLPLLFFTSDPLAGILAIVVSLATTRYRASVVHLCA